MSVNHPVSDLVSIIRNGYLAKKNVVKSPYSSSREAVIKILKDEGYILSYSKTIQKNKKLSPSVQYNLNINLKYHLSRPVVSEIKTISKPGKRVYCSTNKIPIIKNGLGTVLISTSIGIMSDYDARKLNFGGEVLLKVF